MKHFFLNNLHGYSTVKTKYNIAVNYAEKAAL